MTTVNTTRTSNNGISTPWEEPKSGFLTKVWPSDATYHYLYKASNADVASAIFGVRNDATINNEEKTRRQNVIANVRKSALYRGSMSRFYLGMLIIAVLLLLKVYYGIKGKLLLNVVKFTFMVSVGFGLYAYFIEKNAGIAQWNDFTNRLSSMQNSGTPPNEILKTLQAEAEQEKNRLASANNHNYLKGALTGYLLHR